MLPKGRTSTKYVRTRREQKILRKFILNRFQYYPIPFSTHIPYSHSSSVHKYNFTH